MVSKQLWNVVSLVATCGAFAALRANGLVFTWGRPEVLCYIDIFVYMRMRH